MKTKPRPAGVTAIAAFFVFGAVMSGLAAVMLAFPGSSLEPLWRLNPRAREAFAPLGWMAVVFLAILCYACSVAALGLWRTMRVGYRVAVSLLAINLIGDTINAIVLHDWRTLIGIPVGGVMIWYLVKSRRAFSDS